MADPLGALRAPHVPVHPDPSFAARLRAQLERALSLLSQGALVPDAAVRPETEQPTRPPGGLTPYVAVRDARRALDWYRDVFAARPLGEPIVMPDGRIGHAELGLRDAVLYLSDEHPEIGVEAPRAGQGASVTLHLQVDDVDAVAARATNAGAALERPPADHPHGRVAVVRDPFGHRWMLNGPPAPTPGGAA